MIDLLVLIVVAAVAIAIGLWLFANLGIVVAVVVLVLFVGIVFAALGAVLESVNTFFERLTGKTSASQPSQRDRVAANASVSTSTQPQVPLDVILRRAVGEFVMQSTSDIKRLNAAAASRESARSEHMERLFKALDQLKAQLPPDSNVAIDIAPPRHLVDVKMKATHYSRSCRLGIYDDMRYYVEPLGHSLVQKNNFDDLTSLLLWLSDLIGKHIAELRTPPRPDAFIASQQHRLYDRD